MRLGIAEGGVASRIPSMDVNARLEEKSDDVDIVRTSRKMQSCRKIERGRKDLEEMKSLIYM